MLNDYHGPNQACLTEIVEKINWNGVHEETRKRFKAFLMFLKTVLIPEPLTWEWLDENMPSLSGGKRKYAEGIRSCLWDVAYIQVANGKLEDRTLYLEQKRIEKLIERMPGQYSKETSDYVDWMKRMSFSLNTIYDRMISTGHFLDWLNHRGVDLKDMSDFLFEEFEEFYRWQWTCAGCDAHAGYDIYADTPDCPGCGASMVRTRWHRNRTVGSACQQIKLFLDWLFAANENRPTFSLTPCHSPIFRCYPKGTVKQIMKYVVSPNADPIEAFVFYLILFHACSPWELLQAQLPIDEAGKAQPLSDARCIIIPEHAPSRGSLSTGRVEKRIDFDPALMEGLSPLLKRVDDARAQLLKGLNHRYVFVSTRGAKHQKPLTNKFIKNTIARGCASAGVGHCTAKILRLTAAAMFADAGVAGILGIMGWSKKRAYELGWLENREVVLPGKIAIKRTKGRQPPAGALAK
jgi:integrase